MISRKFYFLLKLLLVVLSILTIKYQVYAYQTGRLWIHDKGTRIDDAVMSTHMLTDPVDHISLTPTSSMQLKEKQSIANNKITKTSSDFWADMEKRNFTMYTEQPLNPETLRTYSKFFINLYFLQNLELNEENAMEFITLLKTVASQTNPQIERRISYREKIYPIILSAMPILLTQKTAITDILWSLGKLGFKYDIDPDLILPFVEQLLEYLEEGESITSRSFVGAIMGLSKLKIPWDEVNPDLFYRVLKAICTVIIENYDDFDARETANLIYG